MAVSVAVYLIDKHRRSRIICDAMMQGIKRMGDRPVLLKEEDYRGPEHDVAVFYGLVGNTPNIFRDYQRDGHKAVYVDLGYWGRHNGGRFAGYHKVVVNARHPNEYFQRRAHDGARILGLGVKIKPWRTGGEHILLAGMGAKGAEAEGMPVEGWELDAIAELRRHTGRKIIYRPKPSWKQAQPLPFTEFSPKEQSVHDVIAGCHAVVTHHSNVAVDGLVAGVPAFCWGGVAAPLALQDLSLIESPLRPDGRETWASAIAWCQWSIVEMQVGLPWRHLKAEGLIPS